MNHTHYRRLFFAVLLLLSTATLFAQPTQTIRGTIKDKLSQETLIGATVILVDSTMTNGMVTDIDGNFRFEKVPLGRQVLLIKYLGYKEVSMPVVVTSGKEVIANISLEQMVIEGKEVSIIAERKKDKANNEMTTVSARSFTIEETSRYAGSLGDPARMATNYAGVSGANDARNDIIIRGNSSLGVLWRLNGVDIPNPNHFGSLGVTGGPLSILNNNQLDKSDFLTGAFPAEYGNATAGTFDLQMRSGNNEKYEYLAQIGFNGFELGAEGPLTKKKNAGSFIINYRYSTLGVFKALGIDFGTGTSVPEYQDISLNLNLPTQKLGKLSLFGIGGISSAEVLDKDRDTTKENLYDNNMRTDGYYKNNMGVLGLSHVYFLNSNTYSKLIIAASTTGQNYKMDSIAEIDNSAIPWYRNNSNQQKFTANLSINKKFSSKNFIKAGIIADRIEASYKDSILEENIFRTITNTEGGSYLYQVYGQWQHKFSDKLSVNTGLHFQQFSLNKSYAIEPRFGIKWEMKEGQSLSFGTGIHSQLQPMYVYFQQTYYPDGSHQQLNRDLKMTKSYHYVLAFDKSFKNNIRLKAETYYQYITNVPVEQRATWFSILNEGADFGVSAVDSLTNKGKGENMGVELTFEKFYSRGYYFLLTASVFDSKYKGSDGVLRNTAFNGNYTLTALGGKEWTIRKKNIVGFNFRTVYAGGKRYVPVDIEASQLKGQTEYDEDNAYKKKFKDYFRTDIKISYRINSKHVTHEFALDIDNVFNIKNIWQQYYDAKSNSIKTEYQLGLFPVPLYRLTF